MDVVAFLDPTTLLVGGVLLLSVLWWLSTRRPPGLPPGPGFALPVIGHLHRLGTDPRAMFREWRRQYGDVFSLYMGGRLVVVLNGFPVIKEAFVKFAGVLSHKPSGVADRLGEGAGILFTSGPVWKEQRKAALEILRELGMGKYILADKIQEEIGHYIRVIEGYEGKAVDLHQLTSASVSNNICSIIFGKRFEYDDADFKDFINRTSENLNSLGVTAVVTLFPILDWLPGDLFSVKKVLANVKHVEDKLITPQLDSHRQNHHEHTTPDFIHLYLRQSEKGGKKSSLDTKNLLKSTGDLFLAGTETTSTIIGWTLLYFLHYPKVQDKCFKEISDVIGTGRLPNMRDKLEMPYLEATIMEVMRIADILPFGARHAPPCDVNFRGYHIPEDTIVLTNFDSIMDDPAIWGDPKNFRPERFIGPDGKVTRPEEFIPFSIGRRNCLGESLARMELFLYLSTLVQRFRFLPPEGESLPTLEGTMGVTYVAKPYKIRAVLRE